MVKTLTKKQLLDRALKELKEKIVSYEKRVDAGIRFLDKKLGRKEWLKKINLKTLDLGEYRLCVCGQVFNDYWNMVSENSWDDDLISEDEAFDYGFNDSHPDDEGHEEDYDLLQSVWVEKLKELKKKASGK